MLTEVHWIFIVAIAFIITYFIGSLRNRKLMRIYSSLLKEAFEPIGKVKYRLTRRGFEAICYPYVPLVKNIRVGVFMADRWNLAHYLLFPFTHDVDRALFMALVDEGPRFTLEVLRRRSRRGFDDFISCDDERLAHEVLSSEVERLLIYLGRSVKSLKVEGKRGLIQVLCSINGHSIQKEVELLMNLCKKVKLLAQA